MDSPTWDDLRVLLALHRHRSFLAAGRALGVSTSTAARRIEALEAAVGRALVHRSSAGTSVEPDALELVELAEQLELGLRAVARDDGARSRAAVSGTVRVSMGEGFVRPVTQVLCELRRAHPELQLELVSELRTADLGRREADVGIRKARSQSSAVVERAVGRLRYALYASAAYVERRLRDGRLAAVDLARHDVIGHEGTSRALEPTAWLVSHGATRFVFRSNSDFAQIEACVAGQGIAVLPEAAARMVPNHGLVRLACDAELPEPTIYLAFHRELRNVPRVRVVIDALDAALRHGLR
nr:LysR family transcriptional regulator [Kofleriaceae bacterium]